MFTLLFTPIIIMMKITYKVYENKTFTQITTNG